MERRVRKGRDGTRYCNHRHHHHRCRCRCMIVLARKAGTVQRLQKTTERRQPGRERAITFARALSLALSLHPFLPVKGLSVVELLAQRGPTDGAFRVNNLTLPCQCYSAISFILDGKIRNVEETRYAETLEIIIDHIRTGRGQKSKRNYRLFVITTHNRRLFYDRNTFFTGD